MCVYIYIKRKKDSAMERIIEMNRRMRVINMCKEERIEKEVGF
jgi:hypothetical protein